VIATKSASCWWALLSLMIYVQYTAAAQSDIQGPGGSGSFGSSLLLLPNGNLVVSDPNFSTPTLTAVGAVYLFRADRTLISTLTGSSANDHVGAHLTLLANSNFVVSSANWNSGPVASVGAVTLVNGTLGLSGVVSPSNSLIGTSAHDDVGEVTALSNGNYVVASQYWHPAGMLQVGAVTWCPAASGCTGIVSATNSLIGSQDSDRVGQGITSLSNGNYVVVSSSWHSDGVKTLGAITWASGTQSIVGVVSAANSLVGEQDDRLGSYGVTALRNGNYVIRSPFWHGGVGAATWGNGTTGLKGVVSASNSLVGTVNGDVIGPYVVELKNDKFVVISPDWANGSASRAGAVTFVDSNVGLVGAVGANNSLVGTTMGDSVGGDNLGHGLVTALSNGNYVVGSPHWNNGTPNSEPGAVTFGNGTTGVAGPVSAANSLIGSTPGDQVGIAVTALSNGKYVAASPGWHNGGTVFAGAVTLCDGSAPATGVVTAANSLVGTQSNDLVGSSVTALTNGNFVVASPFWNNGAIVQAGAATWVDGSAGLIGSVSSSNSLVGTTSNDQVGFDGGFGKGAVALSNGNYVVPSVAWNNSEGALTWANGSRSLVGNVSASNSFSASNSTAIGGITAFDDGSFAAYSPFWEGIGGAVTFASGTFRIVGQVAGWNSVLNSQWSRFPSAVGYDASRHLLAVGRPDYNAVSLFTAEQIFSDNLER
jgi:hypothetical protein